MSMMRREQAPSVRPTPSWCLWGFFHFFRYFRCFLIAPVSRCPADILWGFLHYLHYLHCFLIAQDGRLSVKTLLLRCEGLFCAYSIAQMFYYANRILGNFLATASILLSLLISNIMHSDPIPVILVANHY